MIALGVHGFHLLLRFTFVRRSFWAYLLLSFPSLLIQFWFERVGRPTYVDGVNGKELKRAGEDLEAKGLTEWMWDVVYWSWGCIVLTTLLGDWAWWFFVSHFLYSPRILPFADPPCRPSFLSIQPGWHTRPSPALVKDSWAAVALCPPRVLPAVRKASVNKKWRREAVRRCNTDSVHTIYTIDQHKFVSETPPSMHLVKVMTSCTHFFFLAVFLQTSMFTSAVLIYIE